MHTAAVLFDGRIMALERQVIDRTGRVWRVGALRTVHPEVRDECDCLVAHAEGVVRRIWKFPDHWATLDDSDLLTIVEAREHARRF